MGSCNFYMCMRPRSQWPCQLPDMCRPNHMHAMRLHRILHRNHRLSVLPMYDLWPQLRHLRVLQPLLNVRDNLWNPDQRRWNNIMCAMQYHVEQLYWMFGSKRMHQLRLRIRTEPGPDVFNMWVHDKGMRLMWDIFGLFSLSARLISDYGKMPFLLGDISVHRLCFRRCFDWLRQLPDWLLLDTGPSFRRNLLPYMQRSHFLLLNM